MPGTYMQLNYIPSPCSLIEKGPGDEGRQSCRTSVCRVAAEGFAARAGDSKWEEVCDLSPLAPHNSSKNDLLNHPPMRSHSHLLHMCSRVFNFME